MASTNTLLEGRTALITGGSRGLGRAIVDLLAESGAKGLSMDNIAPERPLPDGWRSTLGDVTRESDLAKAFAIAADTFGELDVAVANAGVVPPWSETEDVDLDEWDRVFAINVRGVMATLKHAVPTMRRAGGKRIGGSIIVMGSLNSWHAHPRQCLYTATKHAVLGIVRATALDLGRHNIRVNAIGPGPIATEALKSRVATRAAQGGPAEDQAFADMAAGSALGRIATERDVAAAALYLASDLSAAVTGTLVPVDAGMR